MIAAATPWWAWLLGVPMSAPWLVLALWYWRMKPRLGAELPPSMGELARRRLTGGS